MDSWESTSSSLEHEESQLKRLQKKVDKQNVRWVENIVSKLKPEINVPW